MPKIPYLLSREGRYYFHRRVPDELVQILGKPVIKESLKTSNYKGACEFARRSAMGEIRGHDSCLPQWEQALRRAGRLVLFHHFTH